VPGRPFLVFKTGALNRSATLRDFERTRPVGAYQDKILRQPRLGRNARHQINASVTNRCPCKTCGLTRPYLARPAAAAAARQQAVGRGRLSSAGAAPPHRSPVCRIILKFQARHGRARPSVGKIRPRAPGRKCVMRCGSSRLESRPDSSGAEMGQEQTQMIIIANGTPIPNAPPTMFANAESNPNPRLNSLRRDMPLPP
jgi:hypothetical protein